MKPLYVMSIGERIALTVVIVLVILFGLAFIGWIGGKWDEAPAAEALYSGVPLDAKLLELDKRGLDEAYHQHVLLLFSVWLKDQAGDPSRFNNGMRTARRAYQTAAERIAAREQQLAK